MLGYFCKKMPRPISLLSYTEAAFSLHTVVLDLPWAKLATAEELQVGILTVYRVHGDSVVLNHNFAFASCGHGGFADLQRVALWLRDPCGFVRHDVLSEVMMIIGVLNVQ
jgi:hypothetical protein